MRDERGGSWLFRPGALVLGRMVLAHTPARVWVLVVVHPPDPFAAGLMGIAPFIS